MKKINLVAIFIAASLINISANAKTAAPKNGVYVEADALGIYGETRLHDRGIIPSNELPAKMHQANRGGGAGGVLGYKQNIGKTIFIAPEIFYDYLHVVVPDYYSKENPSATDARLAFRGRHGAKLNLGVNFTKYIF